MRDLSVVPPLVMSPSIWSLPFRSPANEESDRNMANTIVGMIGMGDMGKMYAKKMSNAGWR